MADTISTTEQLDAIKRGLTEAQREVYDAARLLQTAQDMADGFGRTADADTFAKFHTLLAMLKGTGAMFENLAERLDEIECQATP